ncbi:hypothetical protein ACFWBN_39335 [Streptomyces sp. NPDC059989]|uniref:hypothetical protein n=1 Tax=Streptomyces sp. NPDC059989 TaxID=3347026 RepID=UPI0036D1EA2E
MSPTQPSIDPAEVPMLLEPFRRRAERQHTAGEGAGLGLSIVVSIVASVVASIARAHGAELVARADPAPDGGLSIGVPFPPEDGRRPDRGRWLRRSAHVRSVQ